MFAIVARAVRYICHTMAVVRRIERATGIDVIHRPVVQYVHIGTVCTYIIIRQYSMVSNCGMQSLQEFSRGVAFESFVATGLLLGFLRSSKGYSLYLPCRCAGGGTGIYKRYLHLLRTGKVRHVSRTGNKRP